MVVNTAPAPEIIALRADGKYPADVAIDYLAKNQPLLTPSWEAGRP